MGKAIDVLPTPARYTFFRLQRLRSVFYYILYAGSGRPIPDTDGVPSGRIGKSWFCWKGMGEQNADSRTSLHASIEIVKMFKMKMFVQKLFEYQKYILQVLIVVSSCTSDTKFLSN